MKQELFFKRRQIMMAKAGRMRRKQPEEGPAGARSSGLKLKTM